MIKNLTALSLCYILAIPSVYAMEENGNNDKTDKDKSELAAMISEHVEFGGALEVEYSWKQNFHKSKKSDISLETAEIDFEISPVDWATGTLAFEFDPDHNFVTVKEAFVTFADKEKYPFFLQTGRLFVPFGTGTGAITGDTLTITDPLTIEVFETREDALLLGYEKNGFKLAGYAFNGDTNRRGIDSDILNGDSDGDNGHRKFNDFIEHYGAAFHYVYEMPCFKYEFGVDYISSVFDSNELSKEFPGALGVKYDPGMAAYFRVNLNGFSVAAEYNTALSRAQFIEENEDEGEDEIHHNIRPSAWHAQVGYETTAYCKNMFYSLLYTESRDLQGKFPQKRFLANVGVWLSKSILLGLEYGHEVDYAVSDHGTGRSANSVISQLVFEW